MAHLSGHEGTSSLENIGYGQILGAQGGGQGLTDIVQALSQQLQQGGYFGTDYSGVGKQVGLGEMGLSGLGASGELGAAGGGGWGEIQQTGLTTQNYQTPQAEYNLENLISMLGEQYGQGADFGEAGPSQEQQGMQSLLSLLQGLQMPSITKEYGQNVGDVQAEMGSRLQELIKGKGIGSKSSRYQNVGSGRRNIGGGGKGKFMSDYYGLQEQGYGMQENLQEGLEEQFMGNVGQWMQLHPYVKE